MLFDLKGKRRRTVQVTYLGLAILMGAGLVLFGIGSSTNGGLGNLFNGGGGSNQANQTIQKQIDAAQKTLQRDPKNANALAQVVKGHYQLATSYEDQNSNYTPGARPQLLAATAAWKRYEAAVKKPSSDLARLAIQAYTGLATLEKNPKNATPYWKGASDAADVLTSNAPNARNFIALVQYASLAGETRKANLAGQQAIRRAPKGQKKAAKQAVAQAKAAAAQQSGASSGATTTPAPAP